MMTTTNSAKSETELVIRAQHTPHAELEAGIANAEAANASVLYMPISYGKMILPLIEIAEGIAVTDFENMGDADVRHVVACLQALARAGVARAAENIRPKAAANAEMIAALARMMDIVRSYLGDPRSEHGWATDEICEAWGEAHAALAQATGSPDHQSHDRPAPSGQLSKAD